MSSSSLCSRVGVVRWWRGVQGLQAGAGPRAGGRQGAHPRPQPRPPPAPHPRLHLLQPGGQPPLRPRQPHRQHHPGLRRRHPARWLCCRRSSCRQTSRYFRTLGLKCLLVNSSTFTIKILLRNNAKQTFKHGKIIFTSKSTYLSCSNAHLT